MIVENPEYLWLIIPLFIVLYFIIRKDFVKIDHELKENKQFMRRRKALKSFIFITRFLIFTLLIILFAKPFIELQTTESGNPKITILIDNSTSMEAFDTSFVNDFVKELKKDIPVTVRTISSDGLTSDIGEESIRYLGGDSNLLLISDLQVTDGLKLEDTATFSVAINSTISAIDLSSSNKDTSVWIEGPEKAIGNQDVTFLVHVNQLNMEEYNLVVSVDGNPVFNIRDTKPVVEVTEQFSSGTHRITAKIIGEDDYPINNEFHKTVTVTPKPLLLYVTRTNSFLPSLLSDFYSIDQQTQIPADLSKYYAVVIEDMNANQIGNVEVLSEYVQEGNGLLVIGGTNSYDRGGYKQSAFETILPVRIGRGDKKQGDSNIVLLVDLSGSTQNVYSKINGQLVEVADSEPLDVIKALAIDVIETLNRGNRVGVVGFAIQDPSDPFGKFGAQKITDIEPLSEIKEKAIDKISRIDVKGQSLFDVGFSGAYSLLRTESGNRNVILISDGGLNIYQKIKDTGLNNVKLMANEGIKTYTVGVGRSVDEDYMKELAAAGGGVYFPADKKNNLKILFGTPEEKDQGDEMTLFVLNPGHFVTQDLELDARIYGFNQVVPKSLARTLVTTDSGEPALVEWRYGIGKVISLTVFSGTAGLGQLLSGDNSRMIIRSINYLIGDPERKLDYVVDIPDTYVNRLAQIYVTSKDYPKSDIELVKIKENYYEGKTKVEEIGFSSVLNKEFAVNYPKEYQVLGMNENAEEIVNSAGGKVFKKENTEEIVQHIKSISKRTRITREFIVWPIIVMILVIYLFEITARKLMENRRRV